MRTIYLLPFLLVYTNLCFYILPYTNFILSSTDTDDGNPISTEPGEEMPASTESDNEETDEEMPPLV